MAAKILNLCAIVTNYLVISPTLGKTCEILCVLATNQMLIGSILIHTKNAFPGVLIGSLGDDEIFTSD